MILRNSCLKLSGEVYYIIQKLLEWIFIEEVIEFTKKIREIKNDYWVSEVVFSPNWWLLLVLTFAPWLIWWRLVDKSRLFEIFFYGSVISLSAILLDDIGSYFVFWIYQYQLVPISPRLNPIDLTIMPITYMFVYQNYKTWKSFIIAQTILAGGAAFLTEPIFAWLDIYKPLNWRYIYSFSIYLILGIFSKWFIGRLVKKQI